MVAGDRGQAALTREHAIDSESRLLGADHV